MEQWKAFTGLLQDCFICWKLLQKHSDVNCWKELKIYQNLPHSSFQTKQYKFNNIHIEKWVWQFKLKIWWLHLWGCTWSIDLSPVLAKGHIEPCKHRFQKLKYYRLICYLCTQTQSLELVQLCMQPSCWCGGAIPVRTAHDSVTKVKAWGSLSPGTSSHLTGGGRGSQDKCSLTGR